MEPLCPQFRCSGGFSLGGAHCKCNIRGCHPQDILHPFFLPFLPPMFGGSSPLKGVCPCRTGWAGSEGSCLVGMGMGLVVPPYLDTWCPHTSRSPLKPALVIRIWKPVWRRADIIVPTSHCLCLTMVIQDGGLGGPSLVWTVSSGQAVGKISLLWSQEQIWCLLDLSGCWESLGGRTVGHLHTSGQDLQLAWSRASELHNWCRGHNRRNNCKRMRPILLERSVCVALHICIRPFYKALSSSFLVFI